MNSIQIFFLLLPVVFLDCVPPARLISESKVRRKKTIEPDCGERIDFGTTDLCRKWQIDENVDLSFWFSNGSEIREENSLFSFENGYPVINSFDGNFGDTFLCKAEKSCGAEDHFQVALEIEQESSSPRAHIECVDGCASHQQCQENFSGRDELDNCGRPNYFTATVESTVTFVCNVRYPTCAPFPKASWLFRRNDVWIPIEQMNLQPPSSSKISYSYHNQYESLTIHSINPDMPSVYSCTLENSLGVEDTVFEIHLFEKKMSLLDLGSTTWIIGAAVLAAIVVFGIGFLIKSKFSKSGGLKQIPFQDLKMRPGWEDAPLLAGNPADFENHIPAHYIIQYELLGGNKMEIGNGCFGVVYTSVVNTDDIPVIRSEINEKRRVALKVGRVENANPEEQKMALESLFKELKIMMKVAEYRQRFIERNQNRNYHQYVIQLLGCGYTPEPTKWPFLVIEYAENGDLLKFLRNVLKDIRERRENGAKASSSLRLTDGDLIKFAFQIAAGMCFLSENNFVHRDLAARNILVSSDLTMKVSDFGLSKEENYYRSSRGKLPWKWMALESIKEHKFTTQSDVWAFGVTMWEIFSLGNAPYQTKTAQEVKDFLEDGNRLAHPPFASRSIYQIMADCWKSNPKERQTFASLTEDLERELQICQSNERVLDLQGHEINGYDS